MLNCNDVASRCNSSAIIYTWLISGMQQPTLKYALHSNSRTNTIKFSGQLWRFWALKQLDQIFFSTLHIRGNWILCKCSLAEIHESDRRNDQMAFECNAIESQFMRGGSWLRSICDQMLDIAHTKRYQFCWLCGHRWPIDHQSIHLHFTQMLMDANEWFEYHNRIMRTSSYLSPAPLFHT